MTDDAKTDSATSPPLTEERALYRSVLLSTVDGDEDLLRVICALFLRSYPPVVFEIRDAILANDGATLARAAHALRGSGGYFLSDSARLLLTDLEHTGQSGDLSSAPARLLDLEAALERLRPELSMLAAGEVRNHEK